MKNKPIVVFLLVFSLILGPFSQIEVSAQLKTIVVPDDFSTIQDYVFPIGKAKPVIELPEVKMQ